MEANLLSYLNSKPGTLFLYFSRSFVQLYNPKTNALETENIPQNILKDLEVADANALAGFFQAIVLKHKLSVASVLVVLSPNTYYEKILEKTGDDQRGEVSLFLDAVPFDSLGSKIYVGGATSRIIAINKNLCGHLVSSLEQNGLSVEAVVPAGLIPPLASNPTLSLESAQYVLKNIPSIKLNTITHTLEINEDVLTDETRIKAPKTIRIYILGGIFAVCILLLTILVISLPR